MNRLFRRNRKRRQLGNIVKRLSRKKSLPESQPQLTLESLENRVLLTTLILPKGDTGEAIFDYADPAETEPGDPDVTIFNQVRIGTLSGMGPSKDVVVEIYTEDGGDLPGNYYLTSGGGTIAIAGGPAGGPVIDEVPSNVLGSLDGATLANLSINALATTPGGITYGITAGSQLVRINSATGTVEAEIGLVSDRDPTESSLPAPVSLLNFTGADIVQNSFGENVMYAVCTGPTAFSIDGNPIPSSYETILVTVDLTTGEADPAARDAFGNFSYSASEIDISVLGDQTDVQTIVLSHEQGHNNSLQTDEPVFLAYAKYYDIPAGEEDPVYTSSIISLSLVDDPDDDSEDLIIQPFVDVDDPEVNVQGLLYDTQDRLFALYDEGFNDQGELQNGQLMLVQLNAAVDQRFLQVVDYGDNPNGDPVYLTGMSFDLQNEMGYATDPFTGTLYTVNVNRLEDDGDGGFIIRGLADAYTVLITSSTPDVYLTFTRWEATDDGPVYTPTDGDLPVMFQDEDDADVSLPDGTGGVMIGSIRQDDPNTPDIVDYYYSPGSYFGVITGTFFNGDLYALPNNQGQEYRPGIFLLPDGDSNPQDIGKIQVGGGVFGDVEISGSIDTFYAGYIGTNEFNVQGDLNNLVVNTTAGGLVESDGSWTPVNSFYWQQFYDGVRAAINVGGTLSSVYSNDSWGMPIVTADPTMNADSFPGMLNTSAWDPDDPVYVPVQREIEGRFNTTFQSGGLAGIVQTDTIETAQYLGDINGKVNVVGYVEGPDDDDADLIDYYSFSLLAGQTIEIRLFGTMGVSNYVTGQSFNPGTTNAISDIGLSNEEGIGLNGNPYTLLDSDGVIVGQYGDLDPETFAARPLVYTADEAGIYTFSMPWFNTAVAYRLEVTGVTDTALGGVNVQNDIRSNDQYNETYFVTEAATFTSSGNIGAINANGYMRSVEVYAPNGELGAIRAGLNTGVSFTYEIGDNGAGFATMGTIVAGQRIGAVLAYSTGTLNIFTEDDLQLLRVGGDIIGYEPTGDAPSWIGPVIAGGNIGVIQIEGSIGPSFIDDGGTEWLLSQSDVGIFANAYGYNASGYIDMIMIGNDLGTTNGVTQQIPVSAGYIGGNVRFVQVNGDIDGVTSGMVPNPGDSYTFTDDSGSVIKISPGYQGPDPDAVYDEDEEIPLAGELTVKYLPVSRIKFDNWLLGTRIIGTAVGGAIVSIESTDGLRVKVDSAHAVDIGRVVVTGVENNSVVFTGDAPLNVLHTEINGAINQIINNTEGDLVSVVIAADAGIIEEDEDDTGTTPDPDDPDADIPLVTPVELIRVNGNLGFTQSSTGQRIESLVIAEAGDVTVNPIGVQTSGLNSLVGIQYIYIDGQFKFGYVEGDVQTIRLNYDKSDEAGQFDGITGGVVITGQLETIRLGDGIADAGTGQWAQYGGLFVGGDINLVEVEGTGHGIFGPILCSADINRISVTDGAQIVGAHHMLGGITIGTVTSFDDYQIDFGSAGTTTAAGEINRIEVKGDQSKIAEADIFSQLFNSIKVYRGAEGIFHSSIQAGGFADDAYAISETIGELIVGGDGIYRSEIIAGYNIDKIKILKDGEIFDSHIFSGEKIGTISADVITGVGQKDDPFTYYYSQIGANNIIENIKVKEEMNNTYIYGGTLEKLNVKGNVYGSYITNARADSIKVKGDLVSTIDLGGENSYLGKLYVGGDYGTPSGGSLTVYGQVGTITVKGDFDSAMYLNWRTETQNDPAGKINDVEGEYELKKLTVKGQIIGFGGIGGDVRSIVCGGAFGIEGTELEIDGDVKSIKIGSGRGMYDLQSDLDVKGSVKSIKVYGDVEGDINISEDLGTLSLIGQGTTPAERADLEGDIVVGGEFKTLKLKNGTIIGSITAEKGPKIKGKVLSTASAAPASLPGADMATTYAASPMTYDIAAAGVAEETTTNIDNTVIVGGGSGLDIDGSLLSGARYVSTGDIDTIHIGGDIEEDAYIVIEGNLDKLIVDGAILGHVHVTGDIGSIEAANIGEDGVTATITAEGDIDDVTVLAEMTESYILAGYNPGFEGGVIVAEFDDNNITATFDPTRFTIDGTLLDPREMAVSGNIKDVEINVLNKSVIAAGVSPGTNSVFGDLDGSDTPGDGLSSIKKVEINSVIGDGDPFGIFADTKIGKLEVNGVKIDTPLFQVSGFRAWELEDASPGDVNGITFEKGRDFEATIGIVPITVSLSGPGTGIVLLRDDLSGIQAIQLINTTDKTKLKIEADGDDVVDVDKIFNGDDELLGALYIDGRIGNDSGTGTVTINGDLGKLSLGGVAPGTEVTIAGDVSKADFGLVEGSSTLSTDISILGDVSKLSATMIEGYATLSTEDIKSFTVKEDMNGSLLADGGSVNKISIKGSLGDNAVISADKDIDKIKISEQTMGGIRAGWNIGSFTTSRMYLASVTAGSDFNKASIKGTVQYSTIAAGLDTGIDASPYNQNEVAGLGSINKVKIKGDFLSSNIIAGIAPGVDNEFGTNDDAVYVQAASKATPPQVVNIEYDVDGDGIDYSTINIYFDSSAQTAAPAYIHSVVINGFVDGTHDDYESYAISSAGRMGTIKANRQAFDGVDNVVVKTIKGTDILGSTIEMDHVRTLEEALSAAFRIQTAGLDGIFSSFEPVLDGDGNLQYDNEGNVIYDSGDDDMVYGYDVSISYHQDGNYVSFHKESGFTINPQGVNYFRVVLDSDQIVSRQGVFLDGESNLAMPSGNGVQGGDFESYFAVADLGDTLTNAYVPYVGDFPVNTAWSIESYLGDNNAYNASVNYLEDDFIRLNGLEQGSILNILLQDAVTAHYPSSALTINPSNYAVDVYHVDTLSSLESNGFELLYEINGRDDLDPARDTLMPGLDELTYTDGQYIGYDDTSGVFYTIDPYTFEVVTLNNTRDTLNSLPELVNNGDIIQSLDAISTQYSDSIWAIAEIFNAQSGITRENLILIENLTAESNDPEGGPGIVISDFDLSDDNIVGTAQVREAVSPGIYQNVLYAVSSTSNALIKLSSDPNKLELADLDVDEVESDLFGYVSEEIGSLGDDTLNIVGLDVNAEGDGLLAVHDEPGYSTAYRVDGLYQIDLDTGLATLYQEFYTGDYDRGGLAVSPRGDMLVGTPLLGSPIGDTFEIIYENETIEHVFGVDGTTMLDSTNTLAFSSRPDYVSIHDEDPYNLLENELGQEFIDGGFYYVFDLAYSTSLGNFSVIISDIEWLNDIEYGNVYSVYTDEPGSAVATIGQTIDPLTGQVDNQYITIDVEALEGDGDVKVFFGSTGMVQSISEVDLNVVGEILGTNANYDMSPSRDLIMPDLDEVAIAGQYFSQRIIVNLSNRLKGIISDPLQEEMLIDVNLFPNLENQVINELSNYANANELIQEFYDGWELFLYDAVAYDSEQEVFALMDTLMLETQPIYVTDPDVSGAVTPLTLDLLSYYYNEVNPTPYGSSFEDIRGLEFGANGEIWAMVTYREVINGGSDSITRDSLIQITDIVNIDDSEFFLASHDLAAAGYEDITSLAFANVPASDLDSFNLYGYDETTNTLLLLDDARQVVNTQGQYDVNVAYGMATPLGGYDNNLLANSDPEFKVIDMDFNSAGNLVAVGYVDSVIDNTDIRNNYLVELSTAPVVQDDTSRLRLIQALPADKVYSAIMIDAANLTGLGNLGFIIQKVDGNPIGDQMNYSVQTEDMDRPIQDFHIFGSDTTVLDFDNDLESDLIISSLNGNSAGEVASEGGFYQFEITFDSGQGDIELSFTDVDWLNGLGDIDSVFVGDSGNTSYSSYVSVASFDDHGLTILIDSGAATIPDPGQERTVILYFGATSDAVQASSLASSVTAVVTNYTSTYDGSVDFGMMVPEDGDYLVRVSSSSIYAGIGGEIADNILKYKLDMMVFDDGNSDFGIIGNEASEAINGEFTTPDGYDYQKLAPSNRALDLGTIDGGNTDLVQDTDYPDRYWVDPGWSMVSTGNKFNGDKVTVRGDLIEPGVAGTVKISANLGCSLDSDVYMFQLQHGQKITLDIDAETLFGYDNVEVTVGLYNADLTSVATVSSLGVGGVETLPSTSSDDHYTAQAVYQINNHGDVIIDPMTDVDPGAGEQMVGTYYIVITGAKYNSVGLTVNEKLNYDLTITTSEVEVVETPASQLVWLDFEGRADADYLYYEVNEGWSKDVIDRPAFDATDFGFENENVYWSVDENGDPLTLREALIEAIAEKVEDTYRAVGLTEDEIDFVTEKPAAGSVYSIVSFGGDLPMYGLAGIAQNVNRHNADRTDMCVALTKAIGEYFKPMMSDDLEVRFDQVVNVVSGTGIHELGHNLGLEHAEEVGVLEPNNVMNYNDPTVDMTGVQFETRNDYWYQEPGFTNEIDLLLRNIGSGTEMGK